MSFHDVIHALPADSAAGRPEDVSVHLCFICLLHLANEKGLEISGCPSLDHLAISNIPL